MKQNLLYFWRIHLAVVFGVAVATAALTGALLVGDSVRGSLRDLTLERLGEIDHALLSERFFRASLADDLSRQPAFGSQFDAVVPAIVLSGSAVDTSTKLRASGVQIQGVEGRFFALWPGTEVSRGLVAQPRQTFPSVAINASLRKALGAQVGDTLLLSFEQFSEVHRESLLGRRDHADVVNALRVTVDGVIPDNGFGRFGLRPDQSLPLNVYLSLSVLQKALDQIGEVNALFVSEKAHAGVETSSTQTLQDALRQTVTLADYGLTLESGEGYLALESTAFVLPANVVNAAKAVASNHGISYFPLLTYLANEINVNGRTVPYSTITALDTQNPLAKFTLIDGEPTLSEGELLLNAWAANDLSAHVGDTVEVAYYRVGAREQLFTERAQFRLKGIVAMEGLAVDRTLTPTFPGIHDADDMSDWEAPFPVDFRKVRPKDEDYWDEHGATPKAFVSLADGQRLWRSRFGDLTAIRFGLALTQINPDEFARDLRESLSPEAMGFVFQPVKAQGLTAASGSTDFSMLFIGFSLFLIASAALLVGLLFRLGIEQRAKEMGVLMAVGYSVRAVRWRFLKEGGLLAAIGGALGLGGAVLYAWLLMVGLRTWWLAAVGTPFLALHVQPLSLVIGYICTLVVIFLTIGWTVWRLGKMPLRELVAGGVSFGATGDGALRRVYHRGHREHRGFNFSVLSVFSVGALMVSLVSVRKQLLAFVSLAIASAMMLFALFSGQTSAVGLFFGSGALLLISGLTFFSIWLGRSRKSGLWTSIAFVGARNSGRQPGRSMLCVALVSCACFVMVAVGANRHTEGVSHDSHAEKASGVGGFSLLAESAVPLHHDLNTADGRFELGFSDADNAVFDDVKVYPFRVLPGEDASCLNLYKPQKPRILGVTDDFIARGGFQFQQTVTTETTPWQLLEQEIAPDVIPAIADYNSAMWILKLGLGKELVVEDEFGQPLRLRLVGLLKSSIFQSEALISEANFIERFPSRSGYGYFLIDTPAPADTLTQRLEETLGDYGFDATSTHERLAGYRAVENTHISTFQTLGGLGFLLGTVGLAIVLLRNVIERSGELATLRAFGFRQSTIRYMLLAENGFLLLVGIGIGTVSALIAVMPNLIASLGEVQWGALTATLVFVFLVGIGASAVAVFFALRRPLLALLKAE